MLHLFQLLPNCISQFARIDGNTLVSNIQFFLYTAKRLFMKYHQMNTILLYYITIYTILQNKYYFPTSFNKILMKSNLI